MWEMLKRHKILVLFCGICVALVLIGWMLRPMPV